jgi:hypothetical protein
MLRRPARGATTRPANARPGAAHGRSVRVGPPPSWRDQPVARLLHELEQLLYEERPSR